MDAKSNYRNNALHLRSQLTRGQQAQLSAQIQQNLIKYIEKHQYKSVHIYISYKNEPDTYKTMEYLLASNYEVYVPCIQNGEMYSTQIYDLVFINGEYGIPEPIKVEPESVDKKFDIVIVPTLAFDANNNRLGYGKGFYDRFLATQPQADKIGLSYSFNKVDNLPTNKHDIPLDVVITENPVFL